MPLGFVDLALGAAKVTPWLCKVSPCAAVVVASVVAVVGAGEFEYERKASSE